MLILQLIRNFSKVANSSRFKKSKSSNSIVIFCTKIHIADTKLKVWVLCWYIKCIRFNCNYIELFNNSWSQLSGNVNHMKLHSDWSNRNKIGNFSTGFSKYLNAIKDAIKFYHFQISLKFIQIHGTLKSLGFWIKS